MSNYHLLTDILYHQDGVVARKKNPVFPLVVVAAGIGLSIWSLNAPALEDSKNLSASLMLVGGVVGIPPLYGLARRLTAQGKRVTAVLGFNRKSEIFLAEEFRALGAEVVIATADGSVGLKGLVTDGMAAVSDYTYLYTCGPEPMLKAVYADCKTSGQFSFEERMGCGFGGCMGCSCKTLTGNKRICKEGPVLLKEEILW